ncbi:MAG TPA: CobW family GTP-binding protein [Acidimicrobiia bacterium]|jgi:G3E family GTPase
MINPPVDVVGGWLGAGKTTLLRSFLETGAGGQRVAVVVNELGEIGIDGEVVEGLGFAERMVELSSGCICCQLDTVHFEVALEELCEEVHPDRVVIETTGVADPGALSARLSELGHHLGAVLTVVDVANLDAVLAEAVGRAQVTAADFLVLSKLDLATPEAAEAAREMLIELNPRAVAVDAPPGAGDLALLFGVGTARAAAPAADVGQAAAPAAGLEAVTWSAGAVERRAVLDALQALPAAVYRAKGVLALTGASVPLVVDVVAGRLSTQWEPALAGREGSTLVLIGRDAARWRHGVLAALDACRSDAATLR